MVKLAPLFKHFEFITSLTGCPYMNSSLRSYREIYSLFLFTTRKARRLRTPFPRTALPRQ